VTGASGFIGGHLTDALTARGDTVIPVKRPYNADALSVTLGGADVVVHLGGIVSAVQERDFYAANVDATRVVAQACRDAGARIVHVSSLAAAGPAPASAHVPRTMPRRRSRPTAEANSRANRRCARSPACAQRS